MRAIYNSLIALLLGFPSLLVASAKDISNCQNTFSETIKRQRLLEQELLETKEKLAKIHNDLTQTREDRAEQLKDLRHQTLAAEHLSDRQLRFDRERLAGAQKAFAFKRVDQLAFTPEELEIFNRYDVVTVADYLELNVTKSYDIFHDFGGAGTSSENFEEFGEQLYILGFQRHPYAPVQMMPIKP